jgi:predicted dehydrogenase
VLIGEVGLNLRRDIFYEKEVTFQVSSSYGPGRYDPEYEILGKDYPIEYVRWTSKRNIETVLDLISNNEVSVKDLITTKYKINDAFDAYKELYSQNPLGIIISYDEEKKDIHTTSFEKKNIFSHNQVKPYIGFLGAGNYASRVLIPAFKKTNSNFLMVNTSSGLSSFKAAKNFFIPSASTDFDKILNNKQINTVVISTQHNLHAEQVITALQHKKNVFVEKPLAIDFKELSDIKDAYEKANSDDESYVRLMVGFNRRFAPQILKIKNLMKNKKNPSYINMMINAGSLPSNHWINNLIIGGGRVIGEACHFIDLITFLMDSKISSFHTSTFSTDNKNLKKQNVSLNLNFQNGNFGSIQYLSIGGKAFPKERIEIFCDDAVLQLDNYRVLRGFNWKSFRYNKLLKQDKGNINCVKNFVDSISSGKEAPISFEEIYHSSKLTIDISQQIK